MSVIRRVHDDSCVSLPVLHPDPSLWADTWIWGPEDNVAHSMTPSCAAVSAVARCTTMSGYAGNPILSRSDVPRVLVEAEDDILRGLSLAPFITMIYPRWLLYGVPRKA